jgi:hypothetical protein
VQHTLFHALVRSRLTFQRDETLTPEGWGVHGRGPEVRCVLLGRLGPWGSFERGELTLAKGVVTFTREGSGPDPLFSAPVEKVRVRFPRLYFGLGLQLTVEGRRHRVWFVSLRSAVGDTTMDGAPSWSATSSTSRR